MASALKNLYSPAFYNTLSTHLGKVLPGFNKAEFIKQIHAPGFDDKELKERMRHTVLVFHNFMPPNYKQAVGIIKKLITQLKANNIGQDSLTYMFLPDYIEVFGLDDFDTSVDAIEYITQFTSCEFAVRPFLIKYPEPMLAQMQVWATHPNHSVRRLASEGSRPRLPWAMAVPALKKDPTPVLPILELLKADASEYVRRSVANNLNDIAKSHPDIVLEIAKRWSGLSKQTDAIIKHGSRTLLKQGHADILQHFGLNSAGINLSGFKILTPTVSIGQSLEFTFNVANTNAGAQTVRLEYAIYYKLKSGQHAKKVFKISERTYEPGQATAITRKQKFTPITTRVFYPGLHKVSVIINGKEHDKAEFELLA